MQRALFLFAAAVALTVPGAASAAGPALKLRPAEVRYGSQPFESFTKKSFEIENRTSEWLRITLESVVMPDDFSPGQTPDSTCELGDTWLAPQETCVHVIGFRPTPFFAGTETAQMRVSAHDEAETLRFEQIVGLVGAGVDLVSDALDVSPLHLRFGRQPFGSHTQQAFSIANTGSADVWVTVEQVHVGDDFSPNQPGSTCGLGSASGPTLLEPGQSCEHIIGFDPSAFFAGREIATMIVEARDAGGALLYSRIVTLEGTAVAP